MIVFLSPFLVESTSLCVVSVGGFDRLVLELAYNEHDISSRLSRFLCLWLTAFSSLVSDFSTTPVLILGE